MKGGDIMGSYFSYSRISTKEETDKQTFARQNKAFLKYEEENNIKFLRNFKDDITGETFERKEWEELYNNLRSGDTVVFKELSRFSRQTEQGIKKYIELMEKGINLVFIDNPTISTDYIKQLGAVAEQQDLIIKKSIQNVIELLLLVEFDRVQKEREIIVKRIKDGINASGNKQGRKVGQLDKINDKLREDIKKYIADRSIKQIDLMKKHKISRNTLKKYIEIEIKGGN